MQVNFDVEKEHLDFYGDGGFAVTLARGQSSKTVVDRQAYRNQTQDIDMPSDINKTSQFSADAAFVVDVYAPHHASVARRNSDGNVTRQSKFHGKFRLVDAIEAQN